MTYALTHDADLPGSRFTGGERGLARYRWDAAAQRVVGSLHFGVDTEGLPGFVHGGALAACADEAMGMAAWCMGFCAPGARVAYDCRGPLRPGSDASLQAWVERSEGRKVWCRARIEAGDRTLVEAEGLFVAIQPTDWTPFSGWPGLGRFTGP